MIKRKLCRFRRTGLWAGYTPGLHKFCRDIRIESTLYYLLIIRNTEVKIKILLLHSLQNYLQQLMKYSGSHLKLKVYSFAAYVKGHHIFPLLLIFIAFNPLSPNSDQHQYSPNNIHTLSRD